MTPPERSGPFSPASPAAQAQAEALRGAVNDLLSALAAIEGWAVPLLGIRGEAMPAELIELHAPKIQAARLLAQPPAAPAPAEAGGPIMPGEVCVHNKSGGTYVVEQRRVSYSRVPEGAALLVLDGRPEATNQIEPYEQYVVYRRQNTGLHFARPARLFDEPGRFSRVAPTPEAQP